MLRQISDSRTIDQYVDMIVELVVAMVRGTPEPGAGKR